MPDQNKITALYYRLSQEDERAGESNSISHQREILTRYAEDKGFGNIREFIDDGYSGVTFDRPGFQEMLKLVEADKIGVIVTKDLSRLGRNYLEVGNYTEFVFPRHNVRYIAINDCCDTLFPGENEFAPLKICSTNGLPVTPQRRSAQCSKRKASTASAWERRCRTDTAAIPTVRMSVIFSSTRTPRRW